MATVRSTPHTLAPDAYEALYQIGSRLHEGLGSVEGALDLIVESAWALLGCDLAWLTLVNEERHTLSPYVIRGFRHRRILELEVAVGQGVGGAAVVQRRPLIIDDYAHYEHDTVPEVREAIEAEGAVSLICAPMVTDDAMVGALYVANRHATEFSFADVGLMSALAAQASIAIANRRLYARLSRQNELLERAFEVHRELTEASLGGVGLRGIGEALARLVGHPVVIEQEVCEPAVLRCGGDSVTAVPTRVTAQIEGAGRELGTVAVEGIDELTPLQTKALEHGATVVALELLKLKAAIDVEARIAGELLHELLECGQATPERLVHRAHQLDIDLGAGHRVVALAANDETPSPETSLLGSARAVLMRRLRGRALSVKRGSEVIIALPQPCDPEPMVLIRAIQEAAAPAFGSVIAGVGHVDRSIADSFRVARLCLSLARAAARGGTIIDYATLGPLRFLLDARDTTQATAMVSEALQPVIDRDRRSRSALLPTLRAYVECDGSYDRTAQQLFISRSALKYRLRQLREALGAPPSDPQLLFRLKLAFSVLDLLEAMGIELQADAGAGHSGGG